MCTEKMEVGDHRALDGLGRELTAPDLEVVSLPRNRPLKARKYVLFSPEIPQVLLTKKIFFIV